MKTNYMMILLVCLSQALMAQSVKVYKNDNTEIDFSISDIDSVKFSTLAGGKTIAAKDWVCLTNSSALSKIAISTGVYEDVEEGLKLYGSASGNTVQLMPVLQSSIMSKTIYLKWKVKGGGSAVSIGVELFSETENMTSAGKALALATNSGIIDDGVWYFTRISIASGKITTVTSKDNYDNNGGEVVATSSVAINKNAKTFSFQTSADKSSYSILAEAMVE
jgi:hypothetical protein